MATKSQPTNLTDIPGEVKKTRKQKKAENSQRNVEIPAAEIETVRKEQALDGEIINKTGRPSIFTEEIAAELCAHLAMGESLRTACKPAHMPSVATVFNWFKAYPTFLEQYERAKREAADMMAEDILDISDDGQNDYMEMTYGDQSIYRINPEALQRSKLRVDTRKWLMSKLQPKKYGDKLDLTSGGEALPTPLLGGLASKALPENTNDDITDGEPS